MPKFHKSKIASLMKIVYVPMLLSIVLILVMNLVSIGINRKNLISQYKDEGMLLAGQIATQLSRNIEAQEYAESILEDKIRVAALAVIAFEETSGIDNERLEDLLKVLDVSELHYMDPSGRILYSTIEGYLGWEPHLQHPLYDFIRSTEEELMEAIRPDDKYNQPIKYGAVKSETGAFVQVGIHAEIVDLAKNQFSYQTVMDQILENSRIIDVRFKDKDLNLMAQSGIGELERQMSVDIAYFKTSDDVWVERRPSTDFDKESYGFYIPIFHGSQLFGVLTLDYSLEAFGALNKQILWVHLGMMLVLILVIAGFQYHMIIMPIHDLEKNIHKIDVERNTFYKLPVNKNSTFKGIIFVINEILEGTYRFIYELYETKEELVGSNEELSAAYQQIQASEEVLRDQYNEIIQQKQHIEHVAFHDELTGLVNRQGFIKEISKKLIEETKGAILLIAIDNFKSINNTLGHQMGDQIIKTIANILRDLSKNVSVCRFSGDEFVIYFSNLKDLTEIDLLIDQMMNRLKESVIVEDKKVHITASIGVSIYPNDAIDVDTLIKNADSAVFKVKARGKNGYLYFNEGMTEEILKKSEIESFLRKAIDEDWFELVYQPQVSLKTGQVVGLEALLRINKSAYGPDVFIPIAETSGLILPIGRWVAEAAIKQMAIWREQGHGLKTIAINFSPVQLRDTGFHTFLSQLLETYNVPSELIEIEVTENILIDNMNEALEYLNRFKEMGIRLTLDDFGTGFSSLSYLSTLPISKVKLDKSVIWKYTSGAQDGVIKNLMALFKSFDLALVAEGVEDQSMVSQLQICGVELVQGYHFSKPVDVSKVYDVVAEIERV